MQTNIFTPMVMYIKGECISNNKSYIIRRAIDSLSAKISMKMIDKLAVMYFESATVSKRLNT